MKPIIYPIAAIMAVSGCTACSSESTSEKNDIADNTIEEVWDFDNIDGWYYFHQDTATVDQWRIDDGKLLLTTRAGTCDRTKMHTVARDFAAGEFTWRTYVPAIGEGEQVSVGSWIYCDDHHELDFEVGPGTSEARAAAGAQPGQLMACMTSQDNPFYSGYTPVEPGWHDFAIRLDVRSDGNYRASWIIDGAVKQTLDLQFGPEIGFQSSCSIENLKFIGDVISTSDYTAMFDRATFKGTRAIK